MRGLLLIVCAACGPNTLLVGIDDEHTSGPNGSHHDASPVTHDTNNDNTVDAGVFDAGHDDCPTNGTGDPIFLMTNGGDIYSFAPLTSSFTFLGKLNCPVSIGAHPHTLAVDRSHILWVMFDARVGENTASTFEGIYRADPVNGYCMRTPYVTDWMTFAPDGLFGMAFAGMPNGTEALFASDSALVRFDPNGLGSQRVGDIDTGHQRVLLSGSGDGRMFAMLPQSTKYPSSLVEINKSNASVIGVYKLALADAPNNDVAMAFWGGDVFVFAGQQDNSTHVYRHRLHDQSTSLVAVRSSSHFLSASVSTCAPH